MESENHLLITDSEKKRSEKKRAKKSGFIYPLLHFIFKQERPEPEKSSLNQSFIDSPGFMMMTFVSPFASTALLNSSGSCFITSKVL